MKSLTSRRSWPVTFSALGFLPFVGLLPKHCDGPGPGDPGGAAGWTSSAGEAGQPSSAAGAPTGEAGGDAGGVGGDSGSGSAPDRVEEPLLGCLTGVSGKTTPGVFEVVPPPLDLPAPDYRWLTDWSGDGQTAVGVFTNEGDTEAYGAFFVSWNSSAGAAIDAKVRIEKAGYQEPPTSLASCDASVRAMVLGEGSLWTTNGLGTPADPNMSPLFHDDLVLSEDGTAIAYFTGIRDQVRPWAEWRSSRGDTGSLLLDPVHSLSWDGFTAFGTSICYTHTCEAPKTYRWNPPGSGEDVTTTAPTPYVAADGESIVFEFDPTRIGIWRDGDVETIDCSTSCQPIAWSSRAQVLLVNRDGDFAIWTEPHGFRRLSTLLTIPAGWTIVPSGLSLDGWTVTGTAASADTPFAYFRATLNADAFR